MGFFLPVFFVQWNAGLFDWNIEMKGTDNDFVQGQIWISIRTCRWSRRCCSKVTSPSRARPAVNPTPKDGCVRVFARFFKKRQKKRPKKLFSLSPSSFAWLNGLTSWNFSFHHRSTRWSVIWDCLMWPRPGWLNWHAPRSSAWTLRANCWRIPVKNNKKPSATSTLMRKKRQSFMFKNGLQYKIFMIMNLFGVSSDFFMFYHFLFFYT